MYAEDKNGNEFIVQATTKNDNEVNGNQSLQGDIEYNKVNAQFINEMDSLWKLYDHEGKVYKIITLNRKGKGDRMYITFTAIPLFFDYMDTDSIFDDKGVHYKYDGHFTAKNAFDKIFTDTPFDYVLVDSAESVEWENFGGGESRLETFKRALDRYHYEFEIRGNTVYLKNQVGRNTSIQYRHRFNASDINQEIDASEQITGIKGYGKFGEGTSEDASEEDYRDARLKREYVSPLAHVIDDKIRWGFFADGRMKVASAMDKKLKSVVENSLKVSVNATIHNLTKQGYPIDVSQAGDRVFLIDERIGFNQEVRIISQSITRNWLGDIIDASITFGDEGLGKRHQSNISTVTKQIGDIFSGKAEMPLSHLDKRVQEISNIINGNTDSIFKYTPNGVIGWNGTDPNYMTKYVGDSIGFSRDGGETYGTAMSADLGIVADYINTGTLRAIMIEGVEIYGSYFESRLSDIDYLTISGASQEMRGRYSRTWRGNTTTHDVRTKLQNGHLRFRNDNLNRSLYMSEFGFSTYIDGEGEEGGSSGSILWWDTEHSPTGQRGITVNSYGGTAALVSDRHHALMKSRYAATIETGESPIDFKTHVDERNSETHFRMSKSTNRADGYLTYGRGDKIGLRFEGTSKGTIQVVDGNNTTGGDTSIEAGLGYFNIVKRRSGNLYVDIQHANIMRVGADSAGTDRIEVKAGLKHTYGSSANAIITSAGTLGISTSASKYKISIENQFKNPIEQYNHSKNILKLDISSWFDKGQAETVAKEIEIGKTLSEDHFTLRRNVGVTAENVENIGFNEHVERNEFGGLESVQYDRLWLHLLPVVKDHESKIVKIDLLEKENKTLKSRLDKIEKLLEVV